MSDTKNQSFRPALKHDRLFVALPIVIAVMGALWMELMLRHFESSNRHERRGIIGYHYSVPDWGFNYRSGGETVEKWAFNVPAGTTLGILLLSAATGVWHLRRHLGLWGVIGLVAIHIFSALGFVAVAVFAWVRAADVFI